MQGATSFKAIGKYSVISRIYLLCSCEAYISLHVYFCWRVASNRRYPWQVWRPLLAARWKLNPKPLKIHCRLHGTGMQLPSLVALALAEPLDHGLKRALAGRGGTRIDDLLQLYRPTGGQQSSSWLCEDSGL